MPNAPLLTYPHASSHEAYDNARNPALLLLFLISCPSVLLSQSTNASLSGRVTDPSKSSIAGAKIAAISTATNFRYESATNNSGEYYLTNLPPGP